MRQLLIILGLFAIGALVGAAILGSASQRPLSQPELQRLAAEASEAEARAAKAWVDAQTEQQAAGAILTGKELSRLGQVVAANVLLIGLSASLAVAGLGGSVAGVRWAIKRSGTIYPDKSGIWPILIAQGKDRRMVIHDPNRALGPTTVYQFTAQPVADFPLPADAPTMAQITTQAQAISLVAASGQANGPTQNTTQRFIGAMIRPHPAIDLPEIRPSQWDISHVDRLLLEAGEPG